MLLETLIGLFLADILFWVNLSIQKIRILTVVFYKKKYLFAYFQFSFKLAQFTWGMLRSSIKQMSFFPTGGP